MGLAQTPSIVIAQSNNWLLQTVPGVGFANISKHNSLNL